MNAFYRLLLAVTLGSASASTFGVTYNFCYRFGTGLTVTGTVDGTPSADGRSVIVAPDGFVTLYFNGEQVPGKIYPVTYDGNDWIDGAVLFFDCSTNCFMFPNADYVHGPRNFTYRFMMNQLPPNNYAEAEIVGTFDYMDEPPQPANWCLTEANEKPVSSAYSIHKGKMFHQTNSAVPTLRPDKPWFFGAAVDFMHSTNLPAPVVVPPNATSSLVIPWDAFNGMFSTNVYFQTQTQLDAAFPPGQYVIDFGDLTNLTAELTLPEDAYPSPLRISNFDAAQQVNADREFTLAWDPPSCTSTNCRIRVYVRNTQGQPVFTTPHEQYLPCEATSFTLPAHTLKAGEDYYALVMYIHAVSQDKVGDPVVLRDASYFATTMVKMSTLPTQSCEACIDIRCVAGLLISGQSGATYVLKYTTEIGNTNFAAWTPLATNVMTASPWYFIDPDSPFSPKRFYGAQRLP